MDGASRWQAFRHITVPLLAYIMLVAVLIRGMDAFREFDIIFVLTGGGPGTATQTIQMLNYRVFGLGHMGLANAFGDGHARPGGRCSATSSCGRSSTPGRRRAAR